MGLPRNETGSFHKDQATLSYTLQNYGPEDSSTVVYQPRSKRAATSSYVIRSGAPPPEALSSPRITELLEESKEASSSATGRCSGWQEGYELAQFLKDYSTDPFNSLYVGPSLASQLGGNGFSLQNQGWAAGLETGRGPSRSSIPHGKNKGCHPASETATVGGDSIGADDYEEMAQAASMLQAIAQNHEAF